MYPRNANFLKNKVLLCEFVLFWWRRGSLLKSEERVGTRTRLVDVLSGIPAL